MLQWRVRVGDQLDGQGAGTEHEKGWWGGVNDGTRLNDVAVCSSLHGQDVRHREERGPIKALLGGCSDDTA